MATELLKPAIASAHFLYDYTVYENAKNIHTKQNWASTQIFAQRANGAKLFSWRLCLGEFSYFSAMP